MTKPRPSVVIPLVDLKAQYLSIKREIDEAISRVIMSSGFILGAEVSRFEEDFATFCRTRHAVGASSGTAALHLALLGCGVGPGDEVITTPFTFVATAESISMAGARPVFVDIEPESYNIDPTGIKRAITRRTKAIIPVHLCGRPAEMGAILGIAAEHGLKVIEDAAQAHGAEYKEQRVGGIGHVACFSFYPSKNLGAYGDAGAVVTSDDHIAATVRLLHDHGRREKYGHLVEGYSYRLDALQAAILRVKLRHLEAWNEARRKHAESYRELLGNSGLGLPVEARDSRSVYHVFVVRSKNRDGLRQQLSQRGIDTGVHYPLPLHLQPAYRRLGYRRGDFPVCEQAASEVLSLPMYPELTRAQIEEIVLAITESTV